MKKHAPLAIKVTIVVILFMLTIALFVSERVLSKLVDIQTAHLEELTGTYVDGLSTALVDATIREDVWEVFAVLDRARQGRSGITAIETIITNSEGRVIASTDPHRFPPFSSLPPDYPMASSDGLITKEAESRAYARRQMFSNGRAIGAIHSELDIHSLIEERRNVLWTLIGSNAVLALILAAIASTTVMRMMRPVAVLARHLEEGIGGEVKQIPQSQIERAGPEFRRVFEAFNRIALGFHEREGLLLKLADEERLASLGRLASGMAHEINNPLGGLFTAIDTLKRHGHHTQARATAINIIDRGLRGIRDIVRATLLTYRSDADGRSLGRQDLDDLRILAAPEARRNRLTIIWNSDLEGSIGLPASSVRQIVLNIFLNACQATPSGGLVDVAISCDQSYLRVEISDAGPGLPASARKIIEGDSGPVAPIGAGTGLGLWMTRRLVDELGGRIEASISALGGSLVSVTLPIRNEERIARVA